ncbi:MAG: gamma-glutamyl-gamma-aminobutyrate hydrolase family protein [Desulfitobacteriaceae bacterium]|nr:gamma-glutamyl-gamma-aminobutyrate hydrolase family protein [Desulfitobacteriaceae bacterium]MDI6913591.1 gamma-glutamyl-gamma-aminobutyrate hydrolase family protein [Desulfitobacteriaceae bacterium]
MRSIIGITCDHDYSQNRLFQTKAYVQAVVEAGGLPLLVPFFRAGQMNEELAQKLNGLMLTGGADIDPFFFGEPMLAATKEIDPERDEWEIALIQEFLRNDKPILGICRGMQVLNVAAGGSIYQDISSRPGTWKHRQQAPSWYPTHSVQIIPESKIVQVLNQQVLRVNSYHHQAVKDVAPGFKVNARSEDGIIEGIESEDKLWVFGIQWHAETMWERDINQLMIFQAFIRACENF